MTPADMAEIHAASFPRGWSEAELSSLLANPTTHVVTSEHGFALLQVIPPDAELLTIAIRPDQRGRGNGRALLDQVIDAAARAAATSLLLDVDARNIAACMLYRSAEFTECGRRSGYYAHGDGIRSDALLMTRPIPAQSTST